MTIDFPSKLIPSRHADRDPAPKNVWDWQDYHSWRDVIWQLLSDVIDQPVKEAFLANPPEYVVGDNLSWLDDIVYSVHGLKFDSKSELADRLSARFEFIRVVHGTRIERIEDVYEKGLLPLDVAAYHARAEEIFLVSDYPKLDREKLEAAIQIVGADIREDRVWFDGNERMLVEDAAHYMIYGSEYLIAIAASLRGFRDYREALRKFGKPTVFVCDVPLKWMSPSVLMEFGGSTLETIIEGYRTGEDIGPGRYEGAGFCIHRILPPEYIVGHYHPNKLKNPLRRY